MGKISTKQLFENYYEANRGTNKEIQMRYIEKPELYAYEMEIGKELVDLNVDELLDLIDKILNTKYGNDVKYILAPQSYDRVASLFRTLFNFYIETTDIIRNPFVDKRMSSKEAMKRFSAGKEVLRYDYVQKVINQLHADLEPDRADYVELIILLYYCGFDRTEDILEVKEGMIDHKNKVAMLPGRRIQLNDRCYTLLEKFHNMRQIEGWRNYLIVPYRNSYFRFIVQKNKADTFDDRSIEEMRNNINGKLAVHVNSKYNGIILNYRNLYWLGFFDYLVKKYGEEKTTEIITSTRSHEDSAIIMAAAREYGVRQDNTTYIRKFLYPYVKIK